MDTEEIDCDLRIRWHRDRQISLLQPIEWRSERHPLSESPFIFQHNRGGKAEIDLNFGKNKLLTT